MISKGVHGGMVGTLTKVREKRVRQGRQPNWIQRPIGTVQFDTKRTADEVMSNLRSVPTHPFA